MAAEHPTLRTRAADERGAVLIQVGVAILVLTAFAMFVIDYGAAVGQPQPGAERGRRRRAGRRHRAGLRRLRRPHRDRPGQGGGPQLRAGQQRVGRRAGRADGRRRALLPRRAGGVPGFVRERRLHSRGRPPHPGAQQPAADVPRVPGRPDRSGRPRDRHGAGGGRQRERLPEAVGGCRQVGGAQPGPATTAFDPTGADPRRVRAAERHQLSGTSYTLARRRHAS